MVTVSYKPTTRNQGATGQAPFPKCFKNMFSCSVQQQFTIIHLVAALAVNDNVIYWRTCYL